jgi:hypothetical protein
MAKVTVGVALGALVGGVAIALTLTTRGRGLLAGLDRTTEEARTLLQHLRGTIRKAGDLVDESLGFAAEIRAVVDEHRAGPGPALH